MEILPFLIGGSALFVLAVAIMLNYRGKAVQQGTMTDMIGKKGVVTEEIDDLAGCGQVSVNGQSWSARALDDGETIPAGASVRVIGAEGVTLICRK